MDKHKCPSCQHCINRRGRGYICGCRSGYRLVNNCCQDIDECDMAPCHGGARCVDFLGRYECQCGQGLVYKDYRCQDVNECTSSPCTYGCRNTYGGYVCTCPYNMVWNSALKTCQFTNPCLINNGGCSQMCVPSGGGYQCKCDVSRGFYLSTDGRSCVIFGINFGFVWIDGRYVPQGSGNWPGIDLDLNRNPTSVTFTCDVHSNVSFVVDSVPGSRHPRLVWLDHNDYLLPCQHTGNQPCRYIVGTPYPVGPDQTLWRSTLTIINPMIPGDLGDYKCKLIYQDFIYCQNFYLNGTDSSPNCIAEHALMPC